MSHTTFDQDPPAPPLDFSKAPLPDGAPTQATEEHEARQSDIIEVEAHSHPSSHISIAEKVIVDDNPDSAPVPSIADVHDKSSDTRVDQRTTDPYIAPPHTVSTSNGFVNQNRAAAAFDPNRNDSPRQTKTFVPASSTGAFDATVPSPHGFYSTIKMSLPTPRSISLDASGESSRNFKQYQLDDGTVVPGTGLGRGRPGVKRGPRTGSSHDNGSRTSTPVSTSMSVSGTPVAASSSSLNKRRRTTSEGANNNADSPGSESVLSDSRESTPEYNPTEETRSGRKIQKPNVIRSTVSESTSPASKRPKIESRNTAPNVSPAIKTHPKIKRRIYRGREQLALCEHCQRGHGPHGNAIVFCDACNKCWHQRCHDPHVPQSTVNDSKAEWFCANCERILLGKKGKKGRANEAAPSKALPAQPQFVGPLIGGAALTQAHKIAFLESRTREQLISLILQGSDLAPALPMFQAPAPQLPRAQFKSNYTTPISSTPGLHTTATATEAEDEGYDSYFDDHAALYPKPGQGVKLPPDAVDLHILLEHPQSRTFSHWIRGMPTREYSGNADIVFQR